MSQQNITLSLPQKTIEALKAHKAKTKLPLSTQVTLALDLYYRAEALRAERKEGK